MKCSRPKVPDATELYLWQRPRCFYVHKLCGITVSSDYCWHRGYKVKYRVQTQKSCRTVDSICSIRCPEASTDHYWGWTEISSLQSSLQSSALQNKQIRVHLVHFSYVGFMKMFFVSYCIFSHLQSLYSQTEVILRICTLLSLRNILCYLCSHHA